MQPLFYMLGTQKNRLIETVLFSTYNICFGWKHLSVYSRFVDFFYQ